MIRVVSVHGFTPRGGLGGHVVENRFVSCGERR